MAMKLDSFRLSSAFVKGKEQNEVVRPAEKNKRKERGREEGGKRQSDNDFARSKDPPRRRDDVDEIPVPFYFSRDETETEKEREMDVYGAQSIYSHNQDNVFFLKARRGGEFVDPARFLGMHHHTDRSVSSSHADWTHTVPRALFEFLSLVQ